MYNRNKKSICLDLQSADGREAALKLIDTADVFIENFRSGAMDKLGFGYESLAARNPRLIYCSEKGFLAGPYATRTALDEVAQMMSGLAYMTGPPGQPLRAGASVIDVLGGLFGALGILAALAERKQTSTGRKVTASLFESAVFLVGQHMAQFAVTGEAAAPMPARISAWAVYEVFQTRDDQSVFVAVVTDGQWKVFCDAFNLNDFPEDPGLASNSDRVAQRSKIIPVIREALAQYAADELLRKLERVGLPFAPISRPEDMFDDEHLNASGGLLNVTLSDGERSGNATRLPALPIQFDDVRPGLRQDVPHIGEHSKEVLDGLGYSAAEISRLCPETRAKPAG
jgi:crotonobetainyl-CoA:carnitine CoA-transferase CaiB-like acyl-CoA transferase